MAATDRQGPVAESDALSPAWLTILLVMGATMVAQAFGRFTWGVVLPSARDDVLGGSNTVAGLFGTLNVTAYLAGTIVVSVVASRINLLGLVRIGLTISTSGLALAAFVPTGPALGVALVLMGLGGAAIWIPSPALAARVLPPERAGMAVGFVGAGIGIGVVFAGQVSGALDSDRAWQSVYRIELIVAVAMLVAVTLVLRTGDDQPSARGGVGGFGALRKIRGWVPLTIAYASFGFGYLLVIGFLVARLKDDAGFTDGEAAAMFSLVGAATIVGGLTLGPLSDRIGRRVTLTAVFTAFGVCGLIILTGSQPWVTIGSIGVGLMFSGMPSLIVAHVVAHTDRDTYGPAFSATTLAFGVAQMISPQVGGALADATGSFTAVFILSAGCSFVGAIASSRLPEDRPGRS